MVLSAVAVLVCACGRPQDEFVDSLPDMQGVGMEISGGAEEGFTGSALSYEGLEVADIAQVTQEIESVPEFLQHARAGIRQLNEHVRRILEPIVAAARESAGELGEGQSRVWTRDAHGLTWRLTIRRLAVNRFAWKVEAKQIGSADSTYKVVLGGGIVRGREAHRGRGFLGIDLDNLKLVDSTFPGQGKLLCGFSHTAVGKTLAYFLRNFTPDSTNHDPVTAAFVGHRVTSTGLTGVKIVGRFNLEGAGPTPTAAKELVRLRVRYLPGTGGRGDVVATGGDIPEGVWYYGVGCWNAAQEEGFKVLFRCTRSTTGTPACEVVHRRGDRSACAFRPDENDDVNRQPTDSLTDMSPVIDGAPDIFAAPDSMPTGETAPQE